MARPAPAPAAARPSESNALARLALAELLVASDDPVECAQRSVHWLAARRVLESEHRLQRDREFLLSLINSVPDPVLLTDTEGRIMISNTRADALFVARENHTEGRQRAVTLNNMLFSAALSRQAIEDGTRREILLVNPTEGSDLLFELLSTTVQHPREGT